MKASNFALSLGLLFALSGAARAQDQGNNQNQSDQGTLKPTQPTPPKDPVASPPNTPQAPATADTPTVQGDTPKDPGGWKGAQPAPAPAGVPEADPLAGKAPVDPQAEEAERKKNDRIIDRNYDEAGKIYDKALATEGESAENLDHRIQVNEKLIADYKGRLAKANAQKRTFQVELYNRTFYLKQQKDKGAIPEDTFDKLMKQEEKKYNEKSAQARSDVEFYEKEIADAEKRLNDLRTERRISTVMTNTKAGVNPNVKKKPPVKQSVAMVNTLKGRMQALSAFEPKNTMDGAPLCDPCMTPAPTAPAAPAGGGDKDTAAAPAVPDAPVQR
jgi:hypothetical protein